MKDNAFPDTPDGRYFVVRGRLWRKSNLTVTSATPSCWNS